jgi:peptidoglycan/xylan/chitin deacetylase (PgdA/CDA1 family)
MSMSIRLGGSLYFPCYVPVLMYHEVQGRHDVGSPYSIPVRQFEAHLDLLKRTGFETVSCRQLLNATLWGRPLSQRAVLITFDDGYSSFMERAVPALVNRGMTATFFLVAGEIGGKNRWDVAKGYPQRSLMSHETIKQLIREGFEIGSHGLTHRDLSTCRDRELEVEILNASQIIQSAFGISPPSFAYPYGSYSQACVPFLQAAGHRLAFGVSPPKSSGNSPFAVRRIFVGPSNRRLRFRVKLFSCYAWYQWLRSE